MVVPGTQSILQAQMIVTTPRPSAFAQGIITVATSVRMYFNHFATLSPFLATTDHRTVTRCAQVSLAAAGMCLWVHAMNQYADTYEEVKPRMETVEVKQSWH